MPANQQFGPSGERLHSLVCPTCRETYTFAVDDEQWRRTCPRCGVAYVAASSLPPSWKEVRMQLMVVGVLLAAVVIVPMATCSGGGQPTTPVTTTTPSSSSRNSAYRLPDGRWSDDPVVRLEKLLKESDERHRRWESDCRTGRGRNPECR